VLSQNEDAANAVGGSAAFAAVIVVLTDALDKIAHEHTSCKVNVTTCPATPAGRSDEHDNVVVVHRVVGATDPYAYNTMYELNEHAGEPGAAQ
jgi:hypothetical protein